MSKAQTKLDEGRRTSSDGVAPQLLKLVRYIVWADIRVVSGSDSNMRSMYTWEDHFDNLSERIEERTEQQITYETLKRQFFNDGREKADGMSCCVSHKLGACILRMQEH